MAIVSYGSLTSEVSGTIKSVRFSKTGGRQTNLLHPRSGMKSIQYAFEEYIEFFGLFGDDIPAGYNYVQMKAVHRLFIAAMEGDVFKILMEAFKALHKAAYLTWRILAALVDPSNISRKDYTWLPQNVFIHVNFYYYLLNGNTLEYAPEASQNNVKPILTCPSYFNQLEQRFELKPTSQEGRPCKLFISASPIIRQGISVCYKWKTIQINDFISGETLNLYSNYIKLYPSPNNFKGNVWFKVILVDPVTGFRSPTSYGAVQYN